MLEMQLKILCAESTTIMVRESDSWEKCSINNVPEIEEFDAETYFWNRYSYVPANERLCLIDFDYDQQKDEISLLSGLMSLLQESKGLYSDWKGIRRGKLYRIQILVYIIGVSDFYNIIQAVHSYCHERGIKEKEKTSAINNEQLIGELQGPARINPFSDDYVEYETPRKEYYELIRTSDEGMILVIERQTKGCDWVSWDKELPAEGDSGTFYAFIGALLPIVIPQLYRLPKMIRIWYEKHLLKKYEYRIISEYGLRGSLYLKTTKAKNKRNRRVFVFQDCRYNRIYAEYEVEKWSGRIKRFLNKETEG